MELAIRIDTQGDGVWDRTEIYDKFSCDPIVGYELYTFADTAPGVLFIYVLTNPKRFVSVTGLYPNVVTNGILQVLFTLFTHSLSRFLCGNLVELGT